MRIPKICNQVGGRFTHKMFHFASPPFLCCLNAIFFGSSCLLFPGLLFLLCSLFFHSWSTSAAPFSSTSRSAPPVFSPFFFLSTDTKKNYKFLNYSVPRLFSVRHHCASNAANSFSAARKRRLWIEFGEGAKQCLFWFNSHFLLRFIIVIADGAARPVGCCSIDQRTDVSLHQRRGSVSRRASGFSTYITVVSFYCFFLSPLFTEFEIRAFHLAAAGKYTVACVQILDIPCIASVVGSWKRNTSIKKKKKKNSNRRLEAAAATEGLELPNFVVLTFADWFFLPTFSYYPSGVRECCSFFHLTPSAKGDLVIFDVVLHYRRLLLWNGLRLIGCRAVPDGQDVKSPVSQRKKKRPDWLNFHFGKRRCERSFV